MVGQWYRHPAMDTLKKGTRVEVRVEPWLYNVIYTQVNGKWVAAVGHNSRAYVGRGRREVEIAFREQTRLSVVKANCDSMSAKVLRAKEHFLHPEHYDVRIGAQQREMRYLFNRLGMTTALLIPPEAMPDHETLSPEVVTVTASGPIAVNSDYRPTAAPSQQVDVAPAARTVAIEYKQPDANPEPHQTTEGIYDDIPGFN